MKKIVYKILIVYAVCQVVLPANAQERSKFEQEKNKELNSTATWVGFSTGINNTTGMLGVNFEQQLKSQLTLHGGLGLSTWGNKLALNVRKYRRYPIGGAFSAGLSYSTGIDEIKMNMNVRNKATGVVVDTTVAMRLNPAGALNLSWGYHFKISKRSKMYFETGYSLGLSPNRQYRILTSGYDYTDVSDFVMRFLKPGGIMLSVGVLFGT